MVPSSQSFSLSIFVILLSALHVYSHPASQPQFDHQSYSSRIVESSKHGIKIKPISVSPLNEQRKPIHFDTSSFNNLVPQSTPQNCSIDDFNQYCLKWSPKSYLKIVRLDSNCEKIEWRTERDLNLTASFSTEGIHMYGGAEIDNQTWPLRSPYDSAYTTQKANSQAVLEPYWLSSSGDYVLVDQTVPLFVKQDASTFALTATIRPPYLRTANSQVHLVFTMCAFENVKVAHQHAMANAFQKPARVPDFRTVQYPIWSTWATYKTNVSETNVLEYANAIVKNGLPNSALEIDDAWETCYGSLTVDRSKFPDMRRLVSKLKERGFRVTLWIHPFVNSDCQPFFDEGKKAGYFVQNDKGSVLTNWWNGEGAYVDFTNVNATNWWVGRLRELQTQTGLDSFKFDAGESDWSPQIAVYSHMDDHHPENIVTAYIDAVQQFGGMVEVRTARGTQQSTPFVRMMDRETTWTGRLSFETLIPTLLQMNIVGYPYVLPDMIGGNAYNGNELSEEMYVRWLQVNVFMPALQFSLPPWNYTEKVTALTKKYIDLHAKYANEIYTLMQKASEDGTPINLPMWWVDPTDPKTYDIDSQFMLGEDILVAPVVHQGATSRDIYLPKGNWQDQNDLEKGPIKGPIMLNDYKADLEVLPYFKRVN